MGKMLNKPKKMQKGFSQKNCGMSFTYKLFGMADNIHRLGAGILKKMSSQEQSEGKSSGNKKSRSLNRYYVLISDAFKSHFTNFNNTECIGITDKKLDCLFFW